MRLGAADEVVESGRTSGQRSWASCRSLIASAPVPSSGMVMELGWSWGNGVSGCAVETPDAIGYSNLSLWAMISCPWAELRKPRTFSASPWFGVLRGHTATTYSRLQRSTPRTSVVPSVSSTSEPSGPLLVTVATAPGMNPASSK
jgi:hypothetical protein